MTRDELSGRCHRLVAKAIKDGVLVKPSRCSHCCKKPFSKNLHGHHRNYSKPLEVEWLCSLCHRRTTAFLVWFNDCMGWLEYCKLKGISPEDGRLPIIHKKTGKPMKQTQFQYWRQHERKR